MEEQMAMMEHHEYEYFNATGEDDNEGAPHYAQFVDPSPYLFLMTLVFCVAVNAILCFAVKAREKRRREQSQNNQKKIEEASSTSSDDTGFSDEVDDNSKSPPPSSYTVPSSKMLVISPTTPSLNTLGFEAVLKKHRPRRRGCARLRLAMQKMEVIYQAAEIDEQDDLSLAADESQKNGDYDDSSATGSSSNRVVEVVLTEEDQDWLNAKYTSPATKDQKDDSRKCDVYSKRMLEIAKWDTDMKRIFRLGIPFVVEATMEAGIEILTMAIVGKLIGTEELSAFVTVSLLMGMTDHIVGGIHESLVTLCPHAMSINKRLVGEYVQLSIVFCVLLTIPLSVFWYYFIDEALEWLGFDEETVKIGHDYAMILVFDLGLMGIGESIHALLDTINLESYSTMLVVAEDLSGFLLILLLALFDHPDLNTVGLVHLFCHVFFMGLNVIIILRKGWFDPYMDGILGSSALRNTKAIQLMLKTGLALSVGYISTEGEWEILTVFASYLGPSAVAAWAIAGTLWDGFEMITEAIGDAAEIRCAYLLGAGYPRRAMMSAYKTLFVGMIIAVLISTFLFIAGNYIPYWLTSDPTLQAIIHSLMPFLGLGNLALSIGQLCWTILGSQGRYRLATITAFLGTCIITVPLSALFSILLDFNLQGQTAAIVMGYMISGSFNAYIVFTSDWEYLSEQLMRENKAENREDG